MQNEKRDLITGGILATISIVYFVLSFQIRQTALISITSAFIPQVCAVCLFLLSLGLIVRSLGPMLAAKGKRAELTEAEAAAKKESRARILAALTQFVVLAIAILLVENVGFVYGMVFYLLVTMLCMSKHEKKNWPVYLIISIVVPVAVYLIFTKAFYMRLPAGFLSIGGGIL